MNFKANTNPGLWLKQLNSKTIDKIFQVDFNNDRHEDCYLAWLFFITFSDLDKFLEIEGDFDHDHIRVNLYPISELMQKLEVNNLPDEPDLWRVYDTQKDETLGKLLGQKIDFIQYGIEKDEFEINGKLFRGQKDLFNFIRFNCDKLSLTMFEGSATGLGVSDNPTVKLNFEETFDIYDTNTESN